MRSCIKLEVRVPDQYGDSVNTSEGESHTTYVVTPITATGVDENGEEILRTLWVHHYISRNWSFWHYNAYCNAWVTDARQGGNAVPIDTIEAKLYFQPESYSGGTDTRNNTHFARTEISVQGIAVPNPQACGHACAEEKGYGRWCTKDGCA